MPTGHHPLDNELAEGVFKAVIVVAGCTHPQPQTLLGAISLAALMLVGPIPPRPSSPIFRAEVFYAKKNR